MAENEELLWPEESPIRFDVKDFNAFLEWGHKQGASDILLEAGLQLALILNGVIVTVSKRRIRAEELSLILQEIFQNSAPNQLRSGTPLDFAYTVMLRDHSTIRFRVNATACRGVGGADNSFEMVLRTIPSEPPSCEALGVEQPLIDACNNKFGLILVTGPTGSGKSTLIGALFRRLIETQRKHVLTYEAPIEFDLKAIPNAIARVVQSEVPTHVPNFKNAVANSLRRAPSIISIGEARDHDTIDSCIVAAETGHLVFSTVHTNNVAMTISRMVNEFSAEERKGITSKLVGSMRLIVHQRLVPGVPKGRVALKEFLVFTEEIRRDLQFILLEKDDIITDIQNLVDNSGENGQSLMADARKKLLENKISIDTFLGLANEIGTEKDLQLIERMRQRVNG